MLSPAWHIEHVFSLKRNKTLLVCAETGQEVSYAELDLLSKQAAHTIQRYGVRQGETVSLMLENSLSFFVPWLGAIRMGARVHLLSTLATAERVKYELELCESKLFIADASAESALRAIPENILNRHNFLYSTLNNFLRESAQSPSIFQRMPGQTAPNDHFQLICTSGTTGKPKAVVQHAGMVLPDILGIINAYQLRASDTTLLVNRLFHVNAQYMSFLPMFLLGGKVVVCRKFEPHLFWPLVKKHGITYSSLVPPAHIGLLEHLPRDKRDYDTLRFLILGADTLTAEDHRAFMEKTDIPVRQVWGMTETGCAGSASPYDELIVPGSIGKPLCGAEMKIADPENGWRELPPNTVGRLIFRGSMSFREYFKNPEATAQAFAPGNGFFDTGDLCYRDIDGNFFFVDRASMSFKVNGEYIRPWDIANVLKRMEGVRDAFAHFAIAPDGKKFVFACVVWQDGAPRKSPQGMWYYLDGLRGKPDGLDWNHKVRCVVFVPNILTGIAKRDIKMLRDMVEQRIGGEAVPGWDEMYFHGEAPQLRGEEKPA